MDVMRPPVVETANQPLEFPFPMREFGKKNKVKRAFNPKWFSKWHWLHYDSCHDKVYCCICIKAVTTKRLNSTAGNIKDSAFIFAGFCNWKDATVAFPNHEKSETHKTAVELVVTLPETTKDVGELLSSTHAAEKSENRKCLITIAENIQFLARQGIALRGDDNEAESNFMQLIKLRAIHQPEMLQWIERKACKYTSPENQNEIISITALQVLREIASSIQKARFFTLMVDEVADAANKEQVVICIRSVDDNFICNEEFIGLYVVQSTESDCIVHILKDAMVRMNLSLDNCRGQCYDGAANMAGRKNGVAAQILSLESRATYTHCYGHALNLAASDTIKQNNILRDTLDAAFEISKLLKYSPKRDAMFSRLKDDLAPSTSGFRTLCPTRWTVRAASLQSILDNYNVFQALWEEIQDNITDSEIKARVIGVEATMKRFNFLFGLLLGECILKHTDNLSKTLQDPTLTASEGQQCAELLCITLSKTRSSEFFDLFWEKVLSFKGGMMWRTPHCLEKEELLVVTKLGVVRAITMGQSRSIIASSTLSVLI